nr:protein ripply1 isoform X1 [Macaca fascicularis]
MDSAACVAAATPVPALALALAPDLAQAPLALPGLLSPSPLLSSGKEVDGSERGTCLWRPWLSSTNDSPRQMRKLVDLLSDLGNRRGSYLAMYFEPHASFCFGQAAGGATAAEVTKAESKFHHPVRLFWPKSHSFDYLYSAGEILLQNFPVQATINLYEDSDNEEEEEDEEEEDEEEK